MSDDTTYRRELIKIIGNTKVFFTIAKGEVCYLVDGELKHLEDVCPDCCQATIQCVEGDYITEKALQYVLPKPGSQGGTPSERCPLCAKKRKLKKDAERQKEKRQASKQIQIARQDCVEYEDCLKHTPHGLPEELGCEDCEEYRPH